MLGAGRPRNHAQFEAVFMAHFAQACRLARWLTGDKADAEDVVQEAALRAYRAIDRFNGVNPRAWTLQIVRNTAQSWVQRRRQASDVPVEDLTETLSGEEPTAEAALLVDERERTLEEAIAALPAPFREVLVLHDIQGLSYREIGEVVGVPIGTVMSRLSRARANLLHMTKELRR